MPDYLLTASDANGRRTVERVTAPTAEAAYECLMGRGLRDIRLQTDDLSSWIHESDRDDLRKLSPSTQLRLLHATRFRVKLLQIVWAYRAGWVIGLAAVALFGWRRYMSIPWTLDDSLLLAAPLAPLAIGIVKPRGASILHQMQSAEVEAKWDEILALVPRHEQRLRQLKSGPSHFFFCTYWRAKALAAKGQLEAAVEELRNARETPGVSQGVYLTHIAMIHAKAHDFENARRYYEQATRDAPHEPLTWFGLAECLAIRFQDSEAARAALRRLAGFALSQDNSEGLNLTHGAIALCEGRNADARSNLEKVHSHLSRISAGTPLAVGLMHITEALLTIACARSGDRDAATRYYAATASFLRRHREDDLLRRCETALGINERINDLMRR